MMPQTPGQPVANGADPNNHQDAKRKRRGSLAKSREYLRMTKARPRCLNQQTVGSLRLIDGLLAVGFRAPLLRIKAYI